jgi:hypothetical protein
MMRIYCFIWQFKYDYRRGKSLYGNCIQALGEADVNTRVMALDRRLSGF